MFRNLMKISHEIKGKRKITKLRFCNLSLAMVFFEFGFLEKYTRVVKSKNKTTPVIMALIYIY